MKVEVNAFELLRLILVKAEEVEVFYKADMKREAIAIVYSMIESAELLKSRLEKEFGEEAEATNKS